MGILYYGLGAVAIALSAVLTAYGAHLSYEHFGSWLGPLMAVSALTLRKHTVRALVFGVLGLACAVVSGSVVIDRTIAGQTAAVQIARDANHPLAVAQQRLADARADEKAAADKAAAECRTGRGKRCASLTVDADAARGRTEVARTKLASMGAKVDEDPAAVQMAAVIGIAPATYRLVQSVSPGTLLELIAPLLAAFGVHALQGLFAYRTPLPASGEKPDHKPVRKRPQGARRKAPTRAKYGTAAYWLARLDNARPDLARLVRAGELSANGAAIRAGWRKGPALRLVAT
jgi:hypothetical protein